MSHHFYKTELLDRTLWYDGISSYNPEKLITLLSKGHDINWCDYITPDIIEYNKIASSDQQIKTKETCNDLNLDWNLPTEYLELNVVQYIIDKHYQLVQHMSEQEIIDRENRLATELVLYNTNQLTNVLRTIIYIINTLTSHNITWGVGRGSSVSSYVLYVIGAHDVDSFKYDLDIDDFLHD